MAGKADLALVVDLRKVVGVVLLEGCECRLLPLKLVVLLRDAECLVVLGGFFVGDDSHGLLDLLKFGFDSNHSEL